MKFILADKSYNKQLCDFVRNQTITGHISMSYARDPDFFAGLEIQGIKNQVIAGVENNKLLGFGCRSIRPMYINGKQQSFGYLSGLRSSTEGIQKLGIFRGYKKLKELHQADIVNGYITTIIDKNKKALKALTFGRANLPFYRDLSTCHTYAIPTKKKKNSKADTNELKVRKAKKGEEHLIISLLNKYGKELNFFPVISENDFGSSILNGLSAEDFLIAENNEIPCGVVAMWNQREFKQNRVKRYSPYLKTLKPFINLILKLGGFHKLPKEDELLHQTYICFRAAKNNDLKIHFRLIKKALELNTNSSFCLIGFHEKDPARKVMSRFFTFDYRSKMYWVDWDEKNTNFNKLDNRAINFEPAIL